MAETHPYFAGASRLRDLHLALAKKARTAQWLTALPDAADFFWRVHHGLTGFAGERLPKLWHVDDDSVDAVLRGRVWIDLCTHAQVFGAFVGAIPLGVADEKTLLGTEVVNGLEIFVLGRALPGDVGENFAAQVRDVFSHGEPAVDVHVVHDHVC